jgi:predicted lipid-binding transport protein (Tim44 family)
VPFCPYCGKEVSEATSVCPHCGKKLGVASGPAEKQYPNRASGLEVAGVVLGMLGALIVIRAGIGMASSDMPSVGFGFIGLGVFLIGILLLLLAGRSKS